MGIFWLSPSPLVFSIEVLVKWVFILLVATPYVLFHSNKVSPKPSQGRTNPYDRSASPLIMLLALLWALSSLSASVLYSGDQNYTRCNSWAWPALSIVQFISETSLSLLLMPLLMQPSIVLAFFTAAAHCLLMATETFRSFSTGLLSSQVDPSLSCIPGLCIHRYKTLHITPLNSMCSC